MKKYIIIVISIIILIIGINNIIDVTSQVPEDKYIELYETLIKDVLSDYSNLSGDYIALDAYSFNISSEKEKQELSKFLKFYNNNVLIASYNVLNTQEYSDKDILKGILIRANKIKYKYNTIELEVEIYKALPGGRGKTYKAKYKFNKWNIKTLNFFIS